MSRKRIVVEVSDTAKAALSTALRRRGKTVAEWFDDQLCLTLADEPAPPPLTASDLETPEKLSDARAVFADLQGYDWAFADEDTGYLAHDVHPYPAKFIPQIPALLISRLSLPGELVVDPFGGSATTAAEAVRLNRRSLSIDANPLAALIGRVKTAYLGKDTKDAIDALVAAATSFLGPSLRQGNWVSDILLRHREWIPAIPNIGHWFCEVAQAELALARHLIHEFTNGVSRDIAYLALSRIILRVSNQESETRYVAIEKHITPGFTLRCFIDSILLVLRRLERTARWNQSAQADFLTGDTRTALQELRGSCAADLIVTSPPYPNATDYHLYHRFRLFWLGHDPRAFGAVEIGSHLKHQRNNSGFDEYLDDMSNCLTGMFNILRPGRFAVLVLGDAIFGGVTFHTSKEISRLAVEIGFEAIGEIERPLHRTKRSFSSAARRARYENILVLRRPPESVRTILTPPKYSMWEYEEKIRKLETEALLSVSSDADLSNGVLLTDDQIFRAKRLVFTEGIELHRLGQQRTWQAILENGDNAVARMRKDPKYATHGIHPYKGKFYPQLAKSLLNIAEVRTGAIVVDPFCGSGTVPLECYLNGVRGFGFDLNPLAARIARTKTGILEVDRAACEAQVNGMLQLLNSPPTTIEKSTSEFKAGVDELFSWFPEPVVFKLNWLLSHIRSFGNPTVVHFFEIVLSSIIREISHQDPTDLRIRRREHPLVDAPVFELFRARLHRQYERLQRYWAILGYKPFPSYTAVINEADARQPETFTGVGLSSASVDLVLTSPPYATALPYIDTDRLSLLAILGIGSGPRGKLERALTGSREIRPRDRAEIEAMIFDPQSERLVGREVTGLVRKLYQANVASNAGFRRLNMAALLWRYFYDMRKVLENVSFILKPGARAYFIVGNNRTLAGSQMIEIETGELLKSIAYDVGLSARTLIDITVTTENYKHQKNAITKNAILELTR